MHKPKFANLRRLLVLPLLGTAVLLFSFTISDTPVTKARKTITLALDAGHGGEDEGAVNTNGVKEKDLALRITNRLASMGEAYNVKVISIRPDDKYVKLEDRSAKANGVSADIMVSVHVNQASGTAGPQDQFNGFDIMIGRNAGNYRESRELGSAIASRLGAINISSRLIDKGLHVLREVHMPAVLIECGYVDNAADIARINDDKELDKLCRSIMNGVVAYYNAN